VDTWLVIGLGNPGATYAGNRHNVGAMVAGELAGRHDAGALGASRGKGGRGVKKAPAASFTAHKARALTCEVRLGTSPGGVPGPRAVLAVPTTYMNESGGPVAALMSFFSVDVDHLIVVHDELDIDAGSSAAAARADTTDCVPSPGRWGPGTT